ncbi:hypothetical protein BDZ91DRAFT_429857 [Kalaharituber pfeilii]|nr:hypothetical protein BDZ91DRAFT_429857 [Kalaharituber pfeilii]
MSIYAHTPVSRRRACGSDFEKPSRGRLLAFREFSYFSPTQIAAALTPELSPRPKHKQRTVVVPLPITSSKKKKKTELRETAQKSQRPTPYSRSPSTPSSFQERKGQSQPPTILTNFPAPFLLLHHPLFLLFCLPRFFVLRSLSIHATYPLPHPALIFPFQPH